MGRIILTISGAVLALALSQDPCCARDSEKGHSATTAEKRPNEPPSSTEDVDGEATTNHEAADKERNNRDLAAQEAMAVAASGQLHEIRRQTWLIGLSAALGGVALIVSVIALGVTIATSRRQLRPYLGIEAVWAERGRTNIFFYEVRNYGQTPAHDVVIKITALGPDGYPFPDRVFGTVDPGFRWVGQDGLPPKSFSGQSFRQHVRLKIAIYYDTWVREQVFQMHPDIDGADDDGRIHFHGVLGTSGERGRKADE